MNTKKPKPTNYPPCTKKELAEQMGVSLSTLQRRLKSAGIETDRTLIPPKKVQEIIEKLDWNRPCKRRYTNPIYYWNFIRLHR